MRALYETFESEIAADGPAKPDYNSRVAPRSSDDSVLHGLLATVLLVLTPTRSASAVRADSPSLRGRVQERSAPIRWLHSGRCAAMSRHRYSATLYSSLGAA